MARRRLLLALAFPVVVAVGAAGIIVALELNPRPGAYGEPACDVALPDDNLVQLAWRDEDAARAQLARWDACDELDPGGPTLRERAEDALTADLVLIVWLVGSLLFACLIARRYQRWYTASMVGIGLTVVYAVADLTENALVRRLIDDDDYTEALPTVTAIKFGAVAGAGAMILVAVALIAGGSSDPRATDVPRRSLREFVRRWTRRLGPTRSATPIPGVAAAPTAEIGGLGIGVLRRRWRSAAFTLGALQSLEAEPSVVAEARWITAVSGGSYMATAWVTARDELPSATPPTWSRRSPEEDHLRRHASYLAAGLGGKLWALARFVFGFAVNLGIVVATVIVLSVPAGWLIETGGDRPGRRRHHRPAGRLVPATRRRRLPGDGPRPVGAGRQRRRSRARRAGPGRSSGGRHGGPGRGRGRGRGQRSSGDRRRDTHIEHDEHDGARRLLHRHRRRARRGAPRRRWEPAPGRGDTSAGGGRPTDRRDRHRRRLLEWPGRRSRRFR